MRKSLRSQKLCRHSAIFTCTLRYHSPAMKHYKSVAYIFRWKTPCSHMTKILTLIFFSNFRGYLSLKNRYKDRNTLFCLHWEMKGKQKSVLQSLNVSKSYSLCGLFAVRCLKICTVNTLMTFIFSWLGNMLLSDTPLIVAIITKDCRIWQKSMVSHSRRFCRFSLAGNTNFHWMF